MWLGGFGLTLYMLVPVSAVPVCALGYLLVIIQLLLAIFARHDFALDFLKGEMCVPPER